MKTMRPDERAERSSGSGLNRRRWLQFACGAGLAAVAWLRPLSLPAQDRKVLEAARAMAAVTGVELPEKWLEPTASLVGVILDYSRVLRELDLGEMEPATFFVAR